MVISQNIQKPQDKEYGNQRIKPDKNTESTDRYQRIEMLKYRTISRIMETRVRKIRNTETKDKTVLYGV
jgi:hypothetical protein